MYTLLELKDKRGLLIDENTALTVKAETEKRELTADEKKDFETRNVSIRDLETSILIEEEKRKIDPAKMVKPPKMEAKEKPFSLRQVILDKIEGRSIDPDYEGVIKEGRSQFDKAGVKYEGSIILPVTEPDRRAAIVTGQTTGTTAGGYAISKDWQGVLPPLTNYLVLAQAGATYLTGLVGDQRIPTYSGTTVRWKGETASATDGAGTWGYVDLNPKRLTAYIDVSKMFLIQDSVGAERMLMENIAKATAVKLESTILGVGAGSVATEPAGLFYSYYTEDSVTTAYSAVIDLEAQVDTSNALTGSLAYITNPKGLKLLRTTAKISSSDSRTLDEILSYPVLVTNSCAGSTLASFTTTTGEGLIFGNWNDLIIGQWGGYDLLVDPYTQATSGTVRIVVNAYFDAAAARSVSFHACNLK